MLLGDRAAHVSLVAGEWYAPIGPTLENRCALIVSNPPYLSEAEWSAAPAVVREFDPRAALVAGPIGTEAIESVISGAERYLADGGVVVLEIGADQGEAASVLARHAGANRIEVDTDLVGRDRVLVVSW